jgi:hypothetical protein
MKFFLHKRGEYFIFKNAPSTIFFPFFFSFFLTRKKQFCASALHQVMPFESGVPKTSPQSRQGRTYFTYFSNASPLGHYSSLETLVISKAFVLDLLI